MADSRRVSAGGVYEKVDTAQYVCETKIFCPECGDKNRGHLWVKSYVDATATLECPTCWHTTSVPKGTESPIPRPDGKATP